MKKYFIAVTSFILLIAASCSNNGASILYEIEQERPITDRNLSNSISIGALVSTESAYFAAAGEIYTKQHDELYWRSAVQPGGTDVYTSSRIGYIDSHLISLCAEFYDGDLAVFVSGDNGSSWGSPVTFSGITGTIIDLLPIHDSYADRERVFLVVKYSDPDNAGLFLHSLYEVTAITDTQTVETEIVNSVSGSRNKIIDITYNSDGSIWAITAAKALSSATVGDGLPSGEYYTGIYYSNFLSSLYIATYNASDEVSTVYVFDGTNWVVDTEDLGKRTYGFGDITVYDSSDTAISALTLGTSSGYYEKTALASEFTAPDVTADSNYENYDFSGATVFRLISFNIAGRYYSFGLTSRAGLWINNALAWDIE